LISVPAAIAVIDGKASTLDASAKTNALGFIMRRELWPR
jgi:hypothetical protein